MPQHNIGQIIIQNTQTSLTKHKKINNYKYYVYLNKQKLIKNN